MTLQQKIHDVWKTNRLLCNSIPSEFLTYAYSPYERLPRAVFTIKDQTVAARTNQGVAVESATVQFVVFETSCAGALNDLKQIISHYDGKTFDLEEDNKYADFVLNHFNVAHDDNHWKADVSFDVKTFRL